MRKTEAAKRNLRHSKKRATGLRRGGKPEARALREWRQAEARKLREQFHE